MSLPKGGWPLLVSEYLVAVRDAFAARAKAIGHRCRSWTCERVADAESESLLVCVSRVTVRVWSDGAVWFHGRDGSAATSFHASLRDSEPAELVAALMRSLDADLGNPARLSEIWRAFGPHDVVSGG